MKNEPISLEQLAERVQALEAQHQTLLEALKLLLPIAIAIPAYTADSAQALKELREALRTLEKTPRSDDFWYLASAMALLLSSKAVANHPTDQQVLEIHHGLRQHKMQ